MPEEMHGKPLSVLPGTGARVTSSKIHHGTMRAPALLLMHFHSVKRKREQAQGTPRSDKGVEGGRNAAMKWRAQWRAKKSASSSAITLEHEPLPAASTKFSSSARLKSSSYSGVDTPLSGSAIRPLGSASSFTMPKGPIVAAPVVGGRSKPPRISSMRITTSTSSNSGFNLGIDDATADWTRTVAHRPQSTGRLSSRQNRTTLLFAAFRDSAKDDISSPSPSPSPAAVGGSSPSGKRSQSAGGNGSNADISMRRHRANISEQSRRVASAVLSRRVGSGRLKPTRSKGTSLLIDLVTWPRTRAQRLLLTLLPRPPSPLLLQQDLIVTTALTTWTTLLTAAMVLAGAME